MEPIQSQAEENMLSVKLSFEEEDIVQLLAELASKTPEYPAHLLCERKLAFLKQIVMFPIAIEHSRPGKNIFFSFQ